MVLLKGGLKHKYNSLYSISTKAILIVCLLGISNKKSIYYLKETITRDITKF